MKNNPAYALDVVGTCYISGNTTIGGILNAGINKITSSYVPVNNEDILNKLYLTTNNYTKSESDTSLALKATITYVDTQNALQLNKSGGVMTGDLEIFKGTIPKLYMSYSNYILWPTVDTDIGLIRFYNNKDANDKFCDIKATVRSGQYMPSVVFATNPSYSATNFNRMVICENGNIMLHHDHQDGQLLVEGIALSTSHPGLQCSPSPVSPI